MKNDPTGAAGEAASKFTGPGLYEIEGSRRVYLDPLPEADRPHHPHMVKCSETPEMRAYRGNWWVDIETIEAMIVRKLADDPRDPLIALISDYRAQLAIYNASGDQTNDQDDVLAAVTIDPPWYRLRDDCPVPTTMEGVIEGLRLLHKELNEGGTGGFELGVLAALVSYFDGRSA